MIGWMRQGQPMGLPLCCMGATKGLPHGLPHGLPLALLHPSPYSTTAHPFAAAHCGSIGASPWRTSSRFTAGSSVFQSRESAPV